MTFGGFSKKLQAWVDAELITKDQSAEILAYEKARKSGKLGRDLTNLGLFTILLGFISVVASNWQIIPSFGKLGLHTILNLVIAFGILRFDPITHPYKRDMCVTALFALFLTFIALIGQVYQLHGELYKTLAVWLAICTPFIWYWGRTYIAITPWLVAVLVTIFLTAINISPSNETAPWVILIAMIYLPLVLLKAARSKLLNRYKPDFVEPFFNIGFLLPGLFASGATTLFYAESRSLDHHNILLGILAVGILLITVLLRPRKDQPYSLDLWIYTIISSLMIFAPLALPHFTSAVCAAILFILYFLYVAWLGARIHSSHLTDWAIRIVMLRLCILYIEIFGTLLTRGIGLILSGILLILLIKYASKIVNFGRRLVNRGV